MTSYLIFEPEVTTTRTKRIRVLSARHGDLLGVIRWFGRWRQYAFWPEPETVFNPVCLNEINGVIRTEMEARR